MLVIEFTSVPNFRMFLMAPSPQSKRRISSLSNNPIHENPLSRLGTAADVPKKFTETIFPLRFLAFNHRSHRVKRATVAMQSFLLLPRKMSNSCVLAPNPLGGRLKEVCLPLLLLDSSSWALLPVSLPWIRIRWFAQLWRIDSISVKTTYIWSSSLHGWLELWGRGPQPPWFRRRLWWGHGQSAASFPLVLVQNSQIVPNEAKADLVVALTKWITLVESWQY